MTTGTPPLKFTTHAALRRRLLLATLTGTPVHISSIRPNSLKPGLTPSEFSLLRLLDAVTNGSHITISVTGTTLLFVPGLIAGTNNTPHTHTLPENCARGVTYYLEFLALLAPFAKTPLSITLAGGVITSATDDDYSIDTFRTAVLPLYAHFDITRNIDVRILARSSGPAGAGAGEVHFTHAHQVRLPRTLHLQTPGRVKRVRGVAYVSGVSAGNNARMIDAARGVLNRFLADVYVYSDVKGAPTVPLDYGKEGAVERAGGGVRAGGRTRKTGVGFGMALVAETGTGVLYSADAVAGAAEAAEEVGRRAAYALLEEIRIAGAVGRTGVMTVLTMMMMGVEGDVGRVVVGREAVGEEFVGVVRDLKAFFGSEIAVRDGDGGNLVVTIVGKGVGNVGRKVA